MKFEHVKVGDIVTRMLSGVVPMKMEVVDVSDDLITCAVQGQEWSYQPGQGWTFDRATGAEIDEELGWGINGTGSYLVLEN